MTISIWRYSHLILAISSSLFILLASVTGIILAFEPISNKLKPYAVHKADTLSLAKTIQVLQSEYSEVINIDIDKNDFVSASVITKEGNNETFYINPFTGKKIGELIEKAPIFKFATNLHRSLFLKSTGRAIIGIVSFLLLLMAITGVILIGKRQGGLSKFFSKVVKEEFDQYYHIIIGRYTLIPIVIVTITGVYLSLEKFSLLPPDKISHQFLDESFTETSKINVADFQLFKNIPLEDVEHLEFPFSDDIEDYFTLKLKDEEILINQFSGVAISTQQKPLVTQASNLSFVLHTGQGSIIWSLVLLFTSAAILFFIYSGFAMSIRRTKKSTVPKNKHKKDQSEFIILVGSETGNTFALSNAFYNALLAAGKTVFITELNKYTTYKKAKQLIIFTSTYGEGEAPTNSKNFEKLISNIQQKNSLQYSVVGFGSMAYPDYCKYAVVVDATLQFHKNFIPNTALHKINNQSFSDFSLWAKKWSEHNGLTLNLEAPKNRINTKNQKTFQLVNRTNLNQDQTFLLHLKPSKKVTFQSGDLLSVYPENDPVERLYSIAKLDNNILLSINKHEFGLCSNYFNHLNINDMTTATIKTNTDFHFPKKAKEVVMIANGTGIAPFLGMINDTTKQAKKYLFWGGRSKESLRMYSDLIDRAFYSKSLSGFFVSFSREESQKKYVQNLIMEKTEIITRVLKSGGVIMICGSVAMQNGVLITLNDITSTELNLPLSAFQDNNQIKTDCY
ncbi:PepSY domain-containing protein [Algibacter lectus]|uniref:PepSY domain-containing protein n=1 Tax=Algibacter lectus TaxID=221126 RepID=UPI0024954CEB|nr:PepSY domain-containing protein [Algibacter lectus]